MVEVLVYLARADGRFVQKEKDAVRRHVIAWHGSQARGAPFHPDPGRVKVDREQFLGALATVAALPEPLRLATLHAAIEVAEASVGVNEDEAVVLAEIEAALFPAP